MYYFLLAESTFITIRQISTFWFVLKKNSTIQKNLTILFLSTFWTKLDCWKHCSLQQCMNKMKVIKTKWENVPDLTNDEKKLCPQKKHGIFELVQLSVHETTTEIFRGSHAVLFLWEVGNKNTKSTTLNTQRSRNTQKILCVNKNSKSWTIEVKK